MRALPVAEVAETFTRCGTPSPPDAEKAEVARLQELLLSRADVPRFLDKGFSATIPVAFHSIEASSGEGHVSAATIAAQVKVLNDAYTSFGIRFVLESSTVTVNDAWFQLHSRSPEELACKQALSKDPAHFLNLYSALPRDEGGKGLLGFAYYPFDEVGVLDGVVIYYRSMPGMDYPGYDEGDTAVHEAGHWLGLYHTFERGCMPPGDEVDDTPFECPASEGCPLGKDTCPQAGVDPIDNYMDYSSDTCMTRFTPLQGRRMNGMLCLHRGGFQPHNDSFQLDVVGLRSEVLGR